MQAAEKHKEKSRLQNENHLKTPSQNNPNQSTNSSSTLKKRSPQLEKRPQKMDQNERIAFLESKKKKNFI